MLPVGSVPFGGWRHHLAHWEACHWILRHRAGYLSEGAFMGRLGANVSGLAYSYAEYAPIGSLQHGYHRLTGFSGRSCSPTNPVRWCDSSSLATPYSGGTMGAGQWRQCEFMAAAERKPNNRASPGGKQANRPVGRWKNSPLWWLAPPPFSTGKRLTRFSGR